MNSIMKTGLLTSGRMELLLGMDHLGEWTYLLAAQMRGHTEETKGKHHRHLRGPSVKAAFPGTHRKSLSTQLALLRPQLGQPCWGKGEGVRAAEVPLVLPLWGETQWRTQ